MDKDRARLIVVTGFGPFGTVRENPTQVLAERASQSVSTSVIPVSAEDVDAWLSDPPPCDIFLHLGVCETGNRYKVEACAYNEATFRIPDARGFQPVHEPIMTDAPLGVSVETTLNIDKLIQRLQKFPVEESTDPGRYVCNYLYYKSLIQAAAKKQVSVFVHVPLVFELDDAYEFLQCLIREIPHCL